MRKAWCAEPFCNCSLGEERSRQDWRRLPEGKRHVAIGSRRFEQALEDVGWQSRQLNQEELLPLSSGS